MKPRFLHIPLVLLLAFVGVGCDSDGDDTPDEERIRATWVAESASLEGPLGVSVPVIEEGGEASLSLSFEAGDVFALVVEGPVGVTVGGQTFALLAAGEATTVRGSYSLRESDETIRFTVATVDGETVPDGGATTVDYALRNGGSDLVLSTDSPAEAEALITFLTGSAELAALVEGGRVSFERAS